jgi:DNA-directed RNA polymerase subunit N (RpoN/RPB10)
MRVEGFKRRLLLVLIRCFEAGRINIHRRLGLHRYLCCRYSRASSTDFWSKLLGVERETNPDA